MNQSVQRRSWGNTAKYQKIAVAVAKKIATGDYKVGQKIKSRTTLASLFNVSPETVRKGINILADHKIVTTKHGSGVWITSQDKALAFVQSYEQDHSLAVIRQDIEEKLESQRLEMLKLEQALEELFQQAKKSSGQFALQLYRLVLKNPLKEPNVSLLQRNIWQNSGATIVALARDETLKISPNPKLIPRQGDVIYFVGSEESQEQMELLFDQAQSELLNEKEPQYGQTQN
ncbi:GntR family transcriptional regulator [Streptococcus moroccensis]|uniref:K+/H+ antiporter YhaU regulatory subunit KhtT n=1 Tax=Streptococcus moroccensis TaxID=1451356 RepID=A0ABT9YS21_9STRE|nr:GntR family transcriptional regulator [Streptococcus moroccensis]MDQ0222788.1 K+/H+ antiporter YhaU regulatory subunit KhtT [Streptococcus moroccensis]